MIEGVSMIKYNKKTIKRTQDISKKKIETSKKLAWFSGICFAIALIYSMSMFIHCTTTDKICDYTMLITLITVTGAVFGTTTAFYYSKARFENAMKLQTASLKSRYLILKDINLLDEYRTQTELENELSKIECSIDNEKTMANQEITYNG